MTLKEFLLKNSSLLPKGEVELLVAHILKKSKEFLITHDDVEIGRLENYKIKRLIAKRKRNIPFAYITGHKEFYGLDFLVNKHTLVPRPDTELLVEEAVKEINPLPLQGGASAKGGSASGGGGGLSTHQTEKLILIDIGTGSGCIPISIIKTVKHKSIKTFAIDISSPALKVARQNAKKHEVDITFLQGSLLEPIFKKQENKKTKKLIEHLIITANLPYLTQEQFDEEPSIQHEPHSALVAKDHGLALYKELLNQIQKYIPATTSLTCFFEIDPIQTLPLSERIYFNFPQAKIEIKKDLSGNDRVMKITFSTSK